MEEERDEEFWAAKRVNPEDMTDPFKMVGLDLMIAYSISQCKDNEQRKKMSNNILVIGGATQFAKFNDELEDRLIENINAYCPHVERVAVYDPLESKQVLASYLSWYGATVMPRLESTKDLMITRARWMISTTRDEQEADSTKKEKSSEFGLRFLKEKIPFQW